MNIKQEKESPQRNGGIKILNVTQIASPALSLRSIATKVEKNTKLVNKEPNNESSKKKQMEHYVLQTTAREDDDDGDTKTEIDFILAEDEALLESAGLGPPTGEITEEFHLTGDEDDDDSDKTQEIVEHVCGKCFKSFRRLNGLRKHLDFCRYDSGYHLRKVEMLKNIDKMERDGANMENKDICFCCDESYETCHLGHISCPDCPKSFKNQQSYERHIFITHSETEDFPCTVCNAKLRSKNFLDLHLEQHRSRGKPFACKMCGKDFTRSYHLKRHQKYSACGANESDSINCKVCNKTFYRLDNLRAHLKQHLSKASTKKEEYMCPICKNCFYSVSTLNIHERTHTGERPFECDLCEKKFPSLVALKKHRRYHTGEKPYSCHVCNQAFAVKEVLNRHMKRHTGERPHKCNECGKSFIQATQLKSHVKTHLRPFECSFCDEKYKTEKQLLRHEITHKTINKTINKTTHSTTNNTTYKSSSQPRKKKNPKFECKACNAMFWKKELLDKHLSLDIPGHPTLMQRTDCAICDKNFDTPKSLHFHILKVHEVDPEEININKPKEEHNFEQQVAPIAITIATSENEIILPHSNTEVGMEPVRFINANSNDMITTGDGVVVEEYILGESTGTVPNETYTVIPLESNIFEPTTVTLPSVPKIQRKVFKRKKTLAETLAEAIADVDNDNGIGKNFKKEEGVSFDEEEKMKQNIAQLLDILVDSSVLKSFGWPHITEESILTKVIEHCGYDLSKNPLCVESNDYISRMHEYIRLLLTVVMCNDSIEELLNNYPIEEVIKYVLGSAAKNFEDDDLDLK